MNSWIPEDHDLERYILGGILLDPDNASVALEELQPLDFAMEKHGKLFETLAEMYTTGRSVDAVTVLQVLEQSGRVDSFGGRDMSHDFLLDLGREVVSVANIASHVRILKDLSIRRKAGRGYMQLFEKCREPKVKTEDILAEGESLVMDLSERRFAQGFLPFSAGVGDALDAAGRAAAGEITGVRTGLKDLDRVTGGLQPTDLIILAGRPAMGKTGLGLTIGWRAAKYYGARVAFFSLEMGRIQLTQRVLCAWRNVDLHKLRTGKLPKEQYPLFEDGVRNLSPISLEIDDASQKTPLQILSQCKRMKKTKGLDLVIIDYLQLGTLESEKETRAQEVDAFAAGCKRVAKDLNIPVVGLAQLNRDVEKRGSTGHRQSDLAEGGIEKHADIIGIIDRPEVHKKDAEPGLAELHIVKFRNGPTGPIPLRFNKESASFSDYIEPHLLEGVTHGREFTHPDHESADRPLEPAARGRDPGNAQHPKQAYRQPRPGEPGFDG